MTSSRNTAPILAFSTPFILAYLVLGFVSRVVIWCVFRADSRITVDGLLGALLIGVGNDVVTTLYLAIPLALVLFLFPRGWVRGRVGGITLGILTFLGVLISIFVAIAEVLFWEEFESRFNLIAVDYLAYPTEVVGNIRESYPLPPLLIGIGIVTIVIWRYLWRRARRDLLETPAAEASFLSRLRPLAGYTCAVIPFALLYSADSLSFSNNRATNELSQNSIATFFRAALNAEIDYHYFYKTLPGDEAFTTLRHYYESLGEKFVSANPRSIARVHPADPAGLTPNLDALAKESLMFRNAYATGTRTVRGLEAMAASFPPIPSESIVKRPGSDNISNWGAIMRENGYHTSFLYGGFGAFDSMNAFFGGNGFQLGDRLDIPDPNFSNIWGVSDEDLFRYAVRYFDTLTQSSKSPFFSLVLSTSNHKPFTFPPGIPGVPISGGGREAGVRYADHAIAQFLKEARTRPWFKDTIFIVIADHDSRVYGRAYVPVERYRIPVLVYAPAHIQPRVSAKVFSALDLAPTILGMLGIGYSAPFYGVDVLKENIPASRPVMFSHNHNIAWYENDTLTVLGLQKEARTFSYSAEKPTDAPLNEKSAELLAAHLQTAYELFKAHQY